MLPELFSHDGGTNWHAVTCLADDDDIQATQRSAGVPWGDETTCPGGASMDNDLGSIIVIQERVQAKLFSKPFKIFILQHYRCGSVQRSSFPKVC